MARKKGGKRSSLAAGAPSPPLSAAEGGAEGAAWVRQGWGLPELPARMPMAGHGWEGKGEHPGPPQLCLPCAVLPLVLM